MPSKPFRYICHLTHRDGKPKESPPFNTIEEIGHSARMHCGSAHKGLVFDTHDTKLFEFYNSRGELRTLADLRTQNGWPADIIPKKKAMKPTVRGNKEYYMAQCVEWQAKGLKAPMIAKKLGIDKSTVYAYLKEAKKRVTTLTATPSLSEGNGVALTATDVPIQKATKPTQRQIHLAQRLKAEGKLTIKEIAAAVQMSPGMVNYYTDANKYKGARPMSSVMTAPVSLEEVKQALHGNGELEDTEADPSTRPELTLEQEKEVERRVRARLHTVRQEAVDALFDHLATLPNLPFEEFIGVVPLCIKHAHRSGEDIWRQNLAEFRHLREQVRLAKNMRKAEQLMALEAK